MVKYFVCIQNEKRPIEKVENRCPGAMMLLHKINNNILISHPPYSILYQHEYENWELYQEINIFLVGNKQKKAETAVHVTHAIINMWKI